MPATAHQQHLNNGSGASSSSFDASPPPPSSSSAAESAFPSTPPLVMPPFLGQGPYLQRGSSASIFHIIGTVAAATPPTSSAIASTGVDDDDDDSSVPSEGRSSEDGWVVSRVNENAADEQPSLSPPVNEHSNGNKEQATTKTEEVNDDIALDRRGSTRTRTTNGQTPHHENNDEVKLKAILNEFGPLDGGRGEERFVSESKGGLFRGVVIVGNLHLTTHRVTFHAVLPPPALLEKSASSAGGLIIKGGPAFVHRKGVLRTNTRLWLELSVEMICTYPNSSPSGHIHPLKTFLLSSVKTICPSDESDPAAITLIVATPPSMKNHKERFEFDTVESAADWRREIAGAMFHSQRAKLMKSRQSKNEERYNAEHGYTHEEVRQEAASSENWDKVRISIPLDRIVKYEESDYLSFAKLITLDIDGPPKYENEAPDVDVDSKDQTFQLQFISLAERNPPFHEDFERALGQARQRKTASSGDRPRAIVDMAAVFNKEREIGDNDDPKDQGHDYKQPGTPDTSVLDEKLAVIFGLGDRSGLWSTPCSLRQAFFLHKGQLVVSSRYIGFYRKTLRRHDIKYRFAVTDCVTAVRCFTAHLGMSGLALQCSGCADTIFEFTTAEARDEAMDNINRAIETRHKQDREDEAAEEQELNGRMPDSSSSEEESDEEGEGARTSVGGKPIWTPSKDDILMLAPDQQTRIAMADADFKSLPKIVNLVPTELSKIGVGIDSERKKLTERHFVMLTIGSRGDVQPYIALALGLMKDGHKCTIVTHDEFKEWVESYDIGFRQAGGDPTALMKLVGEHPMYSPKFFKESLGHFRQWLDELFNDAWVACQDADVLIESPSAMAGIHIAEALKIPYFRAFTMPWTRTHDYPQAFMVPPVPMGGNFNYSTYALFENTLWQATSGQVNKWRRKQLKLGRTDMSHLAQANVPFIYNFSTAVVPHPVDWKDNIMISGYWFLEESDKDWSPSKDLENFIKKARADKKPLVYIGFGSIVVPDPAATTKTIVSAVEKADVRAIIAKGWSAKGGDDQGKKEDDVKFPDSCYSMDKVPHGWLFSQIDAAMHHGGAGTTGASLRAGVPTLIKPWFGDQFFWADRVQRLGLGLSISAIDTKEIAEALITATTDKAMRYSAQKVGKQIRAEHGVDTAIQWIYLYINTARNRHALDGLGHGHKERFPSVFKTAALFSTAAQKLSHAIGIGKTEPGHHISHT